MKKEDEIMAFLNEKVFDPILDSPKHSITAKRGIRYARMRLEKLNAKGIWSYYWSAIIGTDRSINFSKLLKKEGATRFEDVSEEFRERFDDKWLRSK